MIPPEIVLVLAILAFVAWVGVQLRRLNREIKRERDRK